MKADLVSAVDRYFRLSWDELTRWDNVRFVVLDCESTGLDPKRDSIVSIGAVGIEQQEVCLEDSFEVFMPIAYNTSAVTLHGITREAAEAIGVEEPVAIERFLHFLRDAVVVGHHVMHDIRLLEAAAMRHFGLEKLSNLTVDTMDLTLRLEEAGVLPRPDGHDGFSLDGLCRRFGIPPHDRHTAMGDAYLTARIFQILLRKARRAGFLRVGELTERYESQESAEEPRGGESRP